MKNVIKLLFISIILSQSVALAQTSDKLKKEQQQIKFIFVMSLRNIKT
jgi:hypothetical protein